MVREDLIFSVVTFMCMYILIRETVALVRRWHDHGGPRAA
jgi:hypothetical protein